MASASDPGNVLQASEGKTRFVRMARLLICGGTTVMRELFDYIIPSANLPAVLSRPHVKTRLTDLKNRKILTSPQWEKLYPPFGAGSVQSTSFDITLIFKLLREPNISGLPPPSGGWDALPPTYDLSLPADMARIKYYRNEFAHAEKMELSEQEFSDYWKKIKDALMRIFGHYASRTSTVTDWETAIDNLLTDSLTEEDIKNAEELKSLYLEARLAETLMFNVKRKDMRESESFQLALSVLKNIIELLCEWLPIRKSSITLMRKTADKLDEIEKEVDEAKYYGSSTGLAGMAFLGAGALVSFATAGAAAPFLIGAGLTTTAGGGLVSGRADYKWWYSNKEHLRKVENALTKDYAKQKTVVETAKKLQDLIKQISEKEKISEKMVLEELLTAFLEGQNWASKCAYISLDQLNRMSEYFSSLLGLFYTLKAVAQISGAMATGAALANGAAYGAIVVVAPIVAAMNMWQLNTISERMQNGSKSEAAQKLRETVVKLDQELHKSTDFLIEFGIIKVDKKI